MSKQIDALKLALEALQRCGSESYLLEREAITAIKEALSSPNGEAQPEQYAKGYADAMNWKAQNHLEHLPTAQKLAEWKLVPKKPTEEMLKAMDECSTEGYDERLYACHAASVYMAAVDVAPTPPQFKKPEQRSDSEHLEPVARSDAYDMIDRFLQNNLNSDADYAEYSKALDSIYLTPPQRKEPEQEPVAWITQGGKGWLRWHKSYDDNKDSVPLYTTPPQRKPLTDEQKHQLNQSLNLQGRFPIIDAIEAICKGNNT